MHYFTPLYSPFMPGFMLAFLPLLIIAAIWSITLKGFALWHAARNEQKWWFIALLIINTLGILEIIYLVWFRPTKTDTHHHAHASHTSSHESGAKA